MIRISQKDKIGNGQQKDFVFVDFQKICQQNENAKFYKEEQYAQQNARSGIGFHKNTHFLCDYQTWRPVLDYPFRRSEISV